MTNSKAGTGDSGSAEEQAEHEYDYEYGQQARSHGPTVSGPTVPRYPLPGLLRDSLSAEAQAAMIGAAPRECGAQGP